MCLINYSSCLQIFIVRSDGYSGITSVTATDLCTSVSQYNVRHASHGMYTVLNIVYLLLLYILGNLPVERAKDAVCFLQRCGVSLVLSYAVCFLQRGGVSLASSAIIYNIVKVTR